MRDKCGLPKRPHALRMMLLVLCVLPQAFADDQETTRSPVLTHASVTVNGHFSHSALLDSNVPRDPPEPLVRTIPRTTRSRGFRETRVRHAFSHFAFRHVHSYACGWMDGHYVYQMQSYWVAPQYTRYWVPAVYKTTVVNGHTYTLLAHNGYYATHEVPGRYESKTLSTWVAGRWSCGVY